MQDWPLFTTALTLTLFNRFLAGMIFAGILVFLALWTAANLVPRAHRNHTWYLEKFGDQYPSGRKRLIPFVY